ncbi:hypothetical protein RMATCC62417_04150 [Rhizopus microsporus]|nr:hypothetical protein RMATCC62417_04150 [Rhizopus microsporus]
MGISKLSHFVKSYPTLSESVYWKVDSTHNNDTFIIDGNAFVYNCAYNHQSYWIYGGQYNTIANAVKRTVQTLTRAGITLIFLFDGALPADKTETRIKRHRSYIQRCATAMSNLNSINKVILTDSSMTQHITGLFLIPPLTLETIIQTLRELDVYVKICEAEADGEVVAMAKEKNAYVVSQDSDMYVYPEIGKGYIQLDTLKVPVAEEASHKQLFISATVFHPDRLAVLLKIDRYMLPLIGTLLGNDYLDGTVCRLAIQEWYGKGIQSAKSQREWPKIVAEFIRMNSQGDVIKNVTRALMPIIQKHQKRDDPDMVIELEDCINNSIQRYDQNSPLVNKDSCLTKATCKKHHIKPAQQKEAWSRQLMDVLENQTFWTSIFLEDVERKSSWAISQALRQEVYNHLGEYMHEQQIIEYVREKQHLEPISFACKESNKIQDKESRFIKLHKSEKLQVSDMDSGVYHLILCLRYMIYYCAHSAEEDQLKDHEIIGIIVATLRSLAPTLGFDEHQVPKTSTETLVLKKRMIHLAAQFQGVIYSSYLLSQIFGLDCQAPLAHIYNGLYFHYYLEKTQNGSSLGSILSDTSPDFLQLFFKTYRMVIKDFKTEILDVFDYNIQDTNIISTEKPKRLNKQGSRQPEKKVKSIKSVSSNNLFTLLDTL